MRPLLWAAGIGAVVAVIYLSRSSASNLAPWRKAMLARADEHVKAGTPYQWGGGHAGVDSWGLDCSGLIIDCAKVAGFELEMNSNAIWHNLAHVDTPEPGDVALFGTSDKAVHIMLVEEWIASEGRAACIGAQNGDVDVTSVEVAESRNAKVMRVPDHRADKRFLGFVSLADIAEGRRAGTAGLGSIWSVKRFG